MSKAKALLSFLTAAAVVLAGAPFSASTDATEREAAVEAIIISAVKPPEEIIIEIDEDEYDESQSEITISVEDFEVPNIGGGDAILVYHTHTTESYDDGSAEGEVTAFRTEDDGRNIVHIGDIVSAQLERGGFNVLHDVTEHEDSEKFSRSYDNSLETMLKYQQGDDAVTTFIDIHRDSIDDSAYARSDIAVKDGVEYARIMFVVGTGEGMTDGEFSQIPDWESNYALAQKITDRLNELVPGIAKDIMVKKGRYNQHVSPQCILAEVGYSQNTLVQAENSAEILGEAICSVLKK